MLFSLKEGYRSTLFSMQYGSKSCAWHTAEAPLQSDAGTTIKNAGIKWQSWIAALHTGTGCS